MSDHIGILKKALEIFKARAPDYDGKNSSVEQNYTRAARIASLWLDKPVTPRDVTLVLASVKMSRLAVSPGHEDSFVDLCNYVAFAAAFSEPEKVATPGLAAEQPLSSVLTLDPKDLQPPQLG